MTALASPPSGSRNARRRHPAGPPLRTSAPDADATSTTCQALREAHELEMWGNLDRCPTPAEALEFWRGNEYEERQLFRRQAGPGTGGHCARSRCRCARTPHTAGIDVLVAPGVPAARAGAGACWSTPRPWRQRAAGRPWTPTARSRWSRWSGRHGCCRPNPGPAGCRGTSAVTAFAPAAGLRAGAGGAVQPPGPAACRRTAWTRWRREASVHGARLRTWLAGLSTCPEELRGRSTPCSRPG